MHKHSTSHRHGHAKRKDMARCILLAYGVTAGLGLASTAQAEQVAAAQAPAQPVAAAAAAPMASTSATDDSTAAPTGGIQQITVTARKVAEKMQDIPLTVSAFSADQLETQHLMRTADLNNLTPGLNFQEGTGRGGAGKFLVRGLTSGVSGQARASTFIDGVYVGNNASNLMFGEMEQIEVMLGPQSTQFGRSTFGGAINYITKDPKRATHGEISISRASLGEKTVDAIISGTVSEEHDLLGQLYVGMNHFDGPTSWRNPADVLHPDGYQLGSTDSKSISGKLVWRPNRELKITSRLSFTKDHDAPANAFVLGSNYRNATYAQVRNGVSQPAYYFSGVVNPAGAYSGGYPNAALNLSTIQDPDYRNETTRATVIADYALGDNAIKLTVADNYEHTKHGNYADADATSFPSSSFLPNSGDVRDKSVELRFDSDQLQRLRYAVGAYYLDLKSTQNASTYASYTCLSICNPTSASALYDATDVSGYTGSITGSSNRAAYAYNYRTGVRDRSVFGGLFYDFTSKWTGSVEGRYQVEDVISWNVSSPANPIGGVVTTNSFLPRFNLQYKINPNAQVYAVVSRGTNPAGLNTSTSIGKTGTGTTEAMRQIKEETLDNFELGFKSAWLDNKLVVNGSYYHMNWKNMQTSATYTDPDSGLFSIVENRGAAKIDGVGLEARWMATDNLSFNGQFSYNYARYTKFCSAQLANLYYGPATASNPLAGGDANCLTEFNVRGVSVAGNRLETSPPKTASVGAEYNHNLEGGYRWFTRGGVQYSDGQYESEMNLARSPDAVVFNLSTGIESGRWTYEVNCRNCSDEDSPTRFTRLTDVRTSSLSSLLGGTGYSQTVGGTLRRPRQFGFNIKYKF